MSSLKFLLTLNFLFLHFVTIQSYQSDPCQVALNDTYYNFDPLKNASGWIYSSSTNNEAEEETSIQYYLINFCSELNLTLIDEILPGTYNSCNQKFRKNTTILYLNQLNTSQNNSIINCKPISANNPIFKEWDFINLDLGLLVSFSDLYYHSKIYLNMTCQNDILWQINSGYSNFSSGFFISVTSKYACPKFSVSQIWQFMQEFTYIFIPIFLAIGFFLCFFGLKKLNLTLHIVGTFASCFVIMLIVFRLLVSPATSADKKLLILILVFIPSLSGGWIFSKFQKFGIFILGTGLGIMLALMIWLSILVQLQVGETVLYIMIGIFGLFCGLISLCIQNDIVIISSSILGSYSLIRAISAICGDYPNEFVIAQSIENGQAVEVSWKIYIYLLGMVGLTIAGIHHQFKMKKKVEEDEFYDSIIERTPVNI